MPAAEQIPVDSPRAVSRRAFMATAAGLAAAWAAEGVAGPRKRRPGEATPPHAHRKESADLEKDLAALKPTLDALRKYELPQAAEPAFIFAAIPRNYGR